MMVFPPLVNLPWLRHGFTLREPGIDTNLDRAEALTALSDAHRKVLKEEGVSLDDLRLGEQVHGNTVVVVDEDCDLNVLRKPIPHADGLVTTRPGIPLGIHVADCCAVYLVDLHRRAIGLLHSGRKGTETNIVKEGVRQICLAGKGDPGSILAVMSPCIQECCYEMDFASEVERQLEDAGVEHIWRQSECTACSSDHFYSYRREKGRTGRMLAFLMMTP